MISTFLEAVQSNPDLQTRLRLATTASELAEAAAEAGIETTAAELVKGFAQLLLDADDATAVRIFDNLSWDVGELAWALKNWDQSAQA